MQEITPTSKRRLIAVTEKSAVVTEETLLALVDLRRSNELQSKRYLASGLQNAFEFVCLVSIETDCLVCGMLRDSSQLGPNVYSRRLILLLRESCMSLRKIMAKDFQDEVARRLPKHLDSARLVHSKIAAFSRSNESALNAVRRGLVAHYDADPENRFQLIERSDLRDTVDLVIEWRKILIPVYPMQLDYVHPTAA